MIAIFLASLWVRPGYACSCAGIDAEFFPTDGATDVATSAAPLILFPAGDGEAPTLATASGEIVTFTAEEWLSSGDHRGLILHPDAPLAPETTYILATSQAESRFTTGAAADAAAPALPALEDEIAYAAPEQYPVDCEGTVSDSDCGDSAYVYLYLAAGDEPYRTEALVTLDDGTTATVLDAGGELYVGTSLCDHSNLDAIWDAQSLTIQWRALDASGNASAWSDPQAVTLPWPEPPDCGEDAEDGEMGGGAGCSAAPGAAGLAGLLAGLLAAARRARRSA